MCRSRPQREDNRDSDRSNESCEPSERQRGHDYALGSRSSQCFLSGRFRHFMLAGRHVYVEDIVAISDAQFRLGAVGAAVVLAVGITVVRFCGSVSPLPAKPEAPTPRGTTTDLIEQANASPVVYQDFLAKDAGTAGLRTPTYEEMSRKLPYRVDEGRRILEVGEPAIDVAGLRLSASREGDAIVLVIENTTKSDLAYFVATEPTPKIAGCLSVQALPYNANVVGKGQREVRVECAYRNGMALAVSRVETVELSPLSAWYLSQVPPQHLAIEDRVARGHRMPKTRDRCISFVSQAVRAGLENGEIGWRDLVDFYARHRCQTYPFPASYRALTSDGQRKIPVL
ncbi:MAG: hypothetical protein ABI867_13630 [Kofleriaceae bacterium]